MQTAEVNPPDLQGVRLLRRQAGYRDQGKRKEKEGLRTKYRQQGLFPKGTDLGQD
jgi:hypothetical protein